MVSDDSNIKWPKLLFHQSTTQLLSHFWQIYAKIEHFCSFRLISSHLSRWDYKLLSFPGSTEHVRMTLGRFLWFPQCFDRSCSIRFTSKYQILTADRLLLKAEGASAVSCFRYKSISTSGRLEKYCTGGSRRSYQISTFHVTQGLAEWSLPKPGVPGSNP